MTKLYIDFDKFIPLSPEFDDEVEDWGGWKRKAWKETSKAIICTNSWSSCVLCYSGIHIDYEVNEFGVDPMSEESFNPMPPGEGIFYWEGRTKGKTYYDGDSESWLEGEWRRPTEEELTLLKEGKNPLPSNEHLKFLKED